MNPELIYFLKVNLAMVVFYGFYRLFFYKDTFFGWRRVTLLSFLVISFLHPLLNIQDWAKQQEPIVAMADIYATVFMPEFMPELVQPASPSIQNSAVVALEEKTNPATILFYVYLGIAALLVTRLLVQLFGLLKLRLQTTTVYIKDVKVQMLNKQAGPFSFFKWIFIYPDAHTEEELKEILTHEQTHARQWHSIDVIFSELLCAVCWFNPFIWLIKREVRSNLEYLADRKVLETGHDCKTYQYHLLGLAHNKQVATLYNNFNVLPLKKRIKMMNKRRTKAIGRAKYFIFPLLAALLLLVSNIEAIARTTERVIEDIVTTTGESIETIDQEDPVVEMAHKMPNFPGGNSELMKFLNKNVKYPAMNSDAKIQGRVIVQFVVNKDGSISDMAIKRSVDPYLDKEALRVIAAMPKWEPAKNEAGEIVRCRYTLPVQFRSPEYTPKKVKAVVGEDGIFQIVEKMPQFPGGQTALMNYLNTNIVYPEAAKANKVQGRVIVQFVVNKNGDVENPVIVRPVNPELDTETIRVIKSMPKWIPGEQDGTPVNCKYTVPVQFKL
ncbi:M56 family metallopeptidase [Bacteroides sp. 519]|uniref:M56 family metallopeptidase n=1 Tax=Bacteroides sp. 519 TaxID=2302937 RepID=UPI0013D61A3D|nr:M56 family metallopeptidase [Bacteroides sp. 519]NDV58731.1 M56 family peptidase [Bacteroides sp. 519]